MKEKVSQQDANDVVFGSAFIAFASSSILVLCCILLKGLLSVYCTTKAAKSIHDRLMSSVIQAPCSWFDATPVGRIVNRFNSDISTVVRTQSAFLGLLEYVFVRTQV